MKKSMILALALLSGVTLLAQNESDILLTSQTLPTGTARSISLSNAMGAIGGDMTAITFNPAGIAVYRSSDFSLSTGLQTNKTEVSYWGTTASDNINKLTLGQIGFVSTFKPLRQNGQGIINSNFGFSYNRMNNFNQNVWLVGNNVNSSMLDMFVIKAQGYTPTQLNQPTNPGYFDANLAYGAYLLSETEAGSKQYFHAFEEIDQLNNINYRAGDGIRQEERKEIIGRGGEYSFTGGFNYGNIFLVGASLNFQTINNEERSVYRELNNKGLTPYYDEDLHYFDYYQNLYRYGTGINFKLGAIFKPGNTLRLGLALHTPTYYQIQQEYYTEIYARYMDDFSENIKSRKSEYDYKLATPMKIIASLGLVIGERGFLSADYEYNDYSTAKFATMSSGPNFDDVLLQINNDVKTVFQPTGNLKIGGEFRATGNIALRAGYGNYGSPYKEEYLTDKMKLNTYSAGFGYRDGNFYIDFAYMLMARRYDYYLYNWDTEAQDLGYLINRKPTAASIQSNTANASITFGLKF